MLSIGVAQTKNSTDVRENFKSIVDLLKKFESQKVDLALFPECALSGCSAKMKTCTSEFLSEFTLSIQSWVNDTGINVILPTAIVEDEKVYNAIFWFSRGQVNRYFKTGLTPSERMFFSVPNNAPKKIIQIKETRLAILVCREAQDEPWTHFSNGEADIILWPGYWGWTKNDKWTSELTSGEHNSVLENMKSWQVPLIQSNFAFNDLEGYSGPGPIGKSVVIDSKNRLIHRGDENKEHAFVVTIESGSGRPEVGKCVNLD